jgi:hypothetical protein
LNHAVAPQPFPLRTLLPWTVVALVLLLSLWLAGFDQGSASQAGTFLHELMHDGRHALALPCH